jgi:glucose/arabinose dehydrogenase/HEAT repeat protein/mono/diheme cytochrome c family protein
MSMQGGSLKGLLRIGIACSFAVSSASVLTQPAPAPLLEGAVTNLTPAAAAQSAAAIEQDANTEVVDGLELNIWAPGLVANPLTLDIDGQGRAFVVASSRAGMLLDIRQHPDWVPEVHSLNSTEDLRAFFRREMAPELSDENDWLPDYNQDGSRDYRDLTVVAERIFRVEDVDGDGVADRSQAVHVGFNEDIASDIAGGILIHDDSLYVTAAPDLWRLRDTTGDGIYDQKTSISHGYSTHPAFSGHDMSALTLGPDGRIYWKIGDIGLNVVDQNGRRWAYPNQGAVLRADPDGSNFEVFATGLRNTQEMAFDKYGNLISVDNDGDQAGETERVVYIVQGSDAGWRSTWQYGKYTDPANNNYNVWMAEELFKPRFEGQAAYITPPIAPYHAGPSGFAYNPGTALSDRWNEHFFISSFTGTAASASVYAFTLEEQGAGYELASDTRVVGGLLSAGVVFGPDGALYLTDWIRGWGATGEGQLWKLDAPEAAANAVRREVSALLAESFSDKSRRDLRGLLAHRDMRVRQRAQFELVAREDARTLSQVADSDDDQLARIHAIWGLGQLARTDLEHADAIRQFLSDGDAQVRAQAAKMLGDARDAGSADLLIAGLTDAAPRVRFFAAEALGRIGANSAIAPIVEMLAENDDRDVYLRTAGVHALENIGDGEALEQLSAHESAPVRIAAVVALRRLRDPRVAAFINDPDPEVVTEAARAINDEGGIAQAIPALAAALDGPVRSESFTRRAINANLRAWNRDAALRLRDFAASESESESMRVEAIEALGVWQAPSNHDRVDGAWIEPIAAADANAADASVSALFSLLDDLTTAPAIQVAILESAVTLGIESATPYAADRMETDDSSEVRLAALGALRGLGGDQAERGVRAALTDADAAVRMAAIEAMPQMPIADATKVEELAAVIDAGDASIGERQSAVVALGQIEGLEASLELAGLLVGIGSGDVAPALQLELIEAAARHEGDIVLSQLDRLGVDRTLDNLADAIPDALMNGGAAAAGRRLVLSHPAAQCVRCHTVGGTESTVGPTLDGIGARLSRAELLESLLEPGASIAPGFGDDQASAMPPMGALLTHREIRDVVEFLSVSR